MREKMPDKFISEGAHYMNFDPKTSPRGSCGAHGEGAGRAVRRLRARMSPQSGAEPRIESARGRGRDRYGGGQARPNDGTTTRKVLQGCPAASAESHLRNHRRAHARGRGLRVGGHPECGRSSR